MHVQKQINQNGYEFNVFVGSILINIYVKCGSIEDAWGLFKKMPSKTT